jgi:hypothetical protein
MKTAICMSVILAAVLSSRSLVAQALASPAEKDFVSGGRVQITLESGGYEIRASADNRIHVRWNEASGARVKLTTNGKFCRLAGGEYAPQ